jgi:hypothetical protein
MWYLGSTPVVAENYGLVFTSFSFAMLALVVVGLRVYTRAFVVKRLGTDDYLMVVAMVSTKERAHKHPNAETRPDRIHYFSHRRDVS